MFIIKCMIWYDYFLKTYKNNTRFEFFRFLLDKGIDVNELMNENNEINFFIHNFNKNWDCGYSVNDDEPNEGYYYFNLLHSDGSNNNPIMFGTFLMYKVIRYQDYDLLFNTGYDYNGFAQLSRKVSRFLRGKTIIVPSTAEKVINSTNDTIEYEDFSPIIFIPTNAGDNYVILENPQIIILGFSNYTNNNWSEKFFGYNIHLISLNKNINSLAITHPIIINYKTKLRYLSSEEITSICFMDEIFET